MIAIDTNILVRVLVEEEDSAQCEQARSLLKQAQVVFLPQVVQVELIWVLESAYEFSKTDIVSVLQHLLESDFYRLQQEAAFTEALKRFKGGNAGFADSLISAESQAEQLELWTFDRKLGNYPGVVRLTEQSLSDLK